MNLRRLVEVGLVMRRGEARDGSSGAGVEQQENDLVVQIIGRIHLPLNT